MEEKWQKKRERERERERESNQNVEVKTRSQDHKSVQSVLLTKVIVGENFIKHKTLLSTTPNERKIVKEEIVSLTSRLKQIN